MKGNHVAKHAHKYNRATVQQDKKKKLKRGYKKHKNSGFGKGDFPKFIAA